MFKLVACIVIYNTKFEEIRNTIEEFYREDINQKLVIIDNTNSGYLKEKILKINSSIDYILSENIGYGGANNIAINKYKNLSDYYIVMNPDIFITIENLKELLSYADKKKEFGIIMPKIIYPSGKNQYLCKLLPTPWNLFARRFLHNLSFLKKLNFDYEFRFTNYNREIEVPVLSGCFMFCNYKNLVKENGFDDRYFMYMEDVDISRKLYKYKNYYFPNIEVVHGFEKSSFKSLKMTMIHIKSSIKYFNKWGWIFDKKRKQINNEALKKYKTGGI